VWLQACQIVRVEESAGSRGVKSKWMGPVAAVLERVRVVAVGAHLRETATTLQSTTGGAASAEVCPSTPSMATLALQ
jgi:hypothetical protein